MFIANTRIVVGLIVCVTALAHKEMLILGQQEATTALNTLLKNNAKFVEFFLFQTNSLWVYTEKMDWIMKNWN